MMNTNGFTWQDYERLLAARYVSGSHARGTAGLPRITLVDMKGSP
jgi:hypothetical protein